MRKIFIVQCTNNEVYNDFIKDATKGIINIISYSYYENILNPIRKSFNITSDINKTQELVDIENYWFNKKHRQALISLLINNILDRDGERTVLFLHLNNKVIANRIRRAFPKVCKTVIIKDNYKPNTNINKHIELLETSDITLNMPHPDEVYMRNKIINNFRIQHIPIKYFVE